MSDGDKSATESFDLTVTPVNDAPSFTKGGDQTVSEDAGARTVSGWATGISAGPFETQTVTFSATNDNNTLFSVQPQVSSNGTLTYTPAANAHGSATVTAKATDNGGTANGGQNESGTQTFTITVTPVNDAPVADNDTATTDEDTATNDIDVLFNDDDVDGDSLSVSSFTQPGHGTVSQNTDGALKYNPDANYHGSDSFTYKARDASLDSNTATVSITVNPVNDKPAADAQTVSADEDTSKQITLEGTDVEGDNLTYTVVDGPQHGSLNGTGANLTYNPASDYYGNDSFTFKVNDGNLDSETATVSITVRAVNDAPVVHLTGASSADEGQTKTYEYTVTDVDNAAPTVTEDCGANGTRTGTPASNSFDCTFPDGPDSTTVSVAADDGETSNNTGNDSIVVTVNNVVPTVTLASSNDLSVDEGSTHTYAYTVSDPGDDAFSVAATYPKCGTDGALVTGSGTTSASGGSFKCFFPDGPAMTNVTIKVADSDGASDTASEAVQVVAVANVAPTVTLSGDPTADEGNTKTYTYTVSDTGDDPNPQINENCGSAQYLSDAAENSFQCRFPDGPASHTVSVSANDGTDTGSGSILVEVVNVAPAVTAPANQNADEGASRLIDLGSFTDPGEDGPWSVTVNWGDGSSDTFTHAPGSLGMRPHTYADNGSYTVEVTVAEAGGSPSDEESFTVNVANVAPTAVDDDPAAVAEGGTVTLNVLANDTDPGDDALSVTSNSNGQNGTVNCAPNGSCAYTPGDPDFFGADSFTYTVSDDDGGSDDGKVNVEVYEVNDAPVGANDTKSTPENTPLVFPASDLVNNDDEGAANENGQTLTVTEVDNPVNGTVDLSNGQITFTPDADYNGPASFKYTVCDDGTTNGAPDPKCEVLTATVNVTVSPVNSRPDASNSADSMDEDAAPITIDFASLVSDKETSDANLTYDIGSVPAAQGTLAGTGSTRAFDSADNFNGTVEISYTVTDRGDPDGCSAPAPCDAPKTSEQKKVTVTVNPINDAPVAVNDSATTDEDTPATGNVLGNDTDVDNVRADLTATKVTEPAHGTLALVPGGSFTYTPDANYHGSDSFTYKVSDGALNSNVATVNITVRSVNDAPKIDSASGPSSVDEGDTRNYSVSASDIENDQLTYKWTVLSGAAHISGADDQSNASVLFRDNGPVSLKVEVSDGNGGKDAKTFEINAANVRPTVTNVTSTSQNVLAGTTNSAVFTGTATDPSPVDTNAGFSWQWTLDGSVYGPFNVNTYKASFSTCGSHAVSAQAVDKDGGVSAPFPTNSVNVYNGAYKAPLVDGTVNKVQKGQVVPVKISVGCGASNLTGLSPNIQLLNGNVSPETEAGSTAVTTTSVSAADAGQTMRPADGGYIYNLRVPDGVAGTKYTIRVNPFGANANHNASGMYIVIEIRK